MLLVLIMLQESEQAVTVISIGNIKEAKKLKIRDLKTISFSSVNMIINILDKAPLIWTNQLVKNRLEP